MNKRNQWWLVFFCLVCSLLLISACGGGGGDGDDGPTIPASYTGVTTQASLDAENADDIVIAAWEGGLPVEDFGDIMPLSAQGQTPSSSAPQVIDLLKKTVMQIVASAQNDIHPTATETETLVGDCGGTATFSISINESTGTFTGSVTFADFCSDDILIVGIMPFSGKASTSTGDIVLLKLVFDEIDVTYDTESQTLTDGSMTISLDSTLTVATVTLKYVLIDNTLEESFWVNNYVMVIDDAAGTATLTGRFYHPVYGYVDITTLTPLTVADTALPTGGVLLFTGAASQARLTFYDDLTNLLELDADNDGIYELSGKIDLGVVIVAPPDPTM